MQEAVLLSLNSHIVSQFRAHISYIYAKKPIPFCSSYSYGSNAYNFILNGAEMTEISSIYYPNIVLTQHLQLKPPVFARVLRPGNPVPVPG